MNFLKKLFGKDKKVEIIKPKSDKYTSSTTPSSVRYSNNTYDDYDDLNVLTTSMLLNEISSSYHSNSTSKVEETYHSSYHDSGSCSYDSYSSDSSSDSCSSCDCGSCD